MTDDVVDHGRRGLLRIGASALLATSALPRLAGAQPAADKLKIGVIGAGNIGGTIGGFWVKAGHPVMFSSRHPEELKPLTDRLGPLAKAGTVAEALAFGDAILLAVPYKAVPQLAKDYAPQFAGKVVLDAGNAVAARDGAGSAEGNPGQGHRQHHRRLLPRRPCGARLQLDERRLLHQGVASPGRADGDPDRGRRRARGRGRKRARAGCGLRGGRRAAGARAGVRPGRPALRPAAHRQGIAPAFRLGAMTLSRPEDSTAPPARPFARILRRLIDVKPEELPALGWCWLYISSVLASYYILRPIRDQMGVAGGVNNLQWLFTGTLVVMIVLNIPYSALVKMLPRRQFIPLTYRFFAVTILAFGAALHFATPEATVWIGRFFFIWTSVFNLFVVSIFWAMVVDIFTSEQGKRLFGFIAAGATIGAIVGSAVTASLATTVSQPVLLLGAALLLEVSIWCVRRLSRVSVKLSERPHPERGEVPIGGTVLAGLMKTLRSPYLLNIGVFLLLYAVTSTLLYFEQASIVSRSFSDRGAQTAFFASIDLAVNVLTLVTQIFLTGRIVRWLGVGMALALLPAMTMLGFGLLAVVPTLVVIVGFQVLRRASNFALTRPAREVLFTVVAREDRYKAKAFIDTAVYRTGDQVGAWSYALIGALGFGVTQAAAVAVILSAAWLANSLWLGKRQDALARQDVDDARVERPAVA